MSGCAGRQYVDEGVAAAREDLQQQLDAVKRDVDELKKSDAAQDGRITTLSETAGEALTRAREAGALLKGRFLYEIRFTDDAVKFGSDRKDLSPEARAALDLFAARLKAENRNVYIEIQGRTDSSGCVRSPTGRAGPSPTTAPPRAAPKTGVSPWW